MRQFAPLALLLAAGCAAAPGQAPFANATRVSTVLVETPYDPLAIRAAGAPFPVEVRGAPPDGAAPAAVAEALRLPIHLGAAPLVPAEEGERGLRLVIAFGGAPLNRFCEPGAGGRALPEGASTTATVGLCRGLTRLTRGEVAAPATRGPGDAAFAPAFGRAFDATLPKTNPNLEADDDSPLRRLGG